MYFRERIKINGKMIGQRDVIRFVDLYKDLWSKIQPSFFEMTVAMAFDYFRNNKIDIAIIETGLGGRLDSTNIITPYLSVITNIGYDHMQMLGNTLPEIAFEKAGIIKNRTPVVIGEWQKETASVFKNKAIQERAPISFASRQIQIKSVTRNIDQQSFRISKRSGPWLGVIKSDFTGAYQIRKIRTVLDACRCWNQYYPNQKLSDPAIRQGLKSVRASTKMIGRWMIIRKDPLVITDAAHNIDGIKSILPDLLKIRAGTRHFVLGFVSDKDVN